MPGETDLNKLLAAMTPILSEKDYVYISVKEGHAALCPLALMQFQENEGLTIIVSREEAERLGVEYTYPCRMITLTIHSSLEAVGFLARITAKLAYCGISMNAVSAYFHDYLFVPCERAEEALRLLQTLAEEASILQR